MIDVTEWFSYDPDTGLVTWLKTPKRRKWIKPGSNYVCEHNQGYRYVTVNKEIFLVHRLGWFLTHGYWPKEIDHIDGNRSNNQLCNLREVTRRENQRNSESRGKTSKFKGVSWSTSRKKWAVYIHDGTKGINLGRFEDEFEAARAYNEAAEAIFGQFARLNEL